MIYFCTKILFRYVLVILLLIPNINCNLFGSYSKTKTEKYLLNSKFELDKNLKFVNVRSASVNYVYSFPQNFSEINLIEDKERIEFNDLINLKMISKDGSAILKHWKYEDNYKINDKSTFEEKEFAVKNYYKSLLNKEYEFLNEAKIIESKYTVDTFTKDKISRENAIYILAEKDGKQIIFKSIYSEIAISGDYVFINMLFEYDKEKERYYEPIGIKLANDFSYFY